MSKKALRLDEIGYWSEVKLDIVRKYAAAYSTIMAKQPSIKRHVYIDASAAYQKTRDLFGEVEEKATNEEVAQAFRSRLRTIAGFKYVPDPMPMRSSKGAIVYYLFFASPNETGSKIVQDIFDDYRNQGVR